MAKLTLTDVAAGYQLTSTVNANNDAIETALETVTDAPIQHFSPTRTLPASITLADISQLSPILQSCPILEPIPICTLSPIKNVL